MFFTRKNAKEQWLQTCREKHVSPENCTSQLFTEAFEKIKASIDAAAGEPSAEDSVIHMAQQELAEIENRLNSKAAGDEAPDRELRARKAELENYIRSLAASATPQ